MVENLDNIDIVQLVISWILKGILGASLIIAFLEQNWFLVFFAALSLIVCNLPILIEKRGTVFLPIEFELVITWFVFASLLLGEGFNFYCRFWWWDLMLHTTSGILLGFVGFLIVYTISHMKNVNLSPVFVAIFTFCFAMALGSLWEIYEFVMDSLLGTNMQHHSLVDTMTDLIVNAIGGIVTAFIGYFYVRGGDSLLFSRLIRKFIAANPKLVAKSFSKIQTKGN